MKRQSPAPPLAAVSGVATTRHNTWPHAVYKNKEIGNNAQVATYLLKCVRAKRTSQKPHSLLNDLENVSHWDGQ